MLRRPSSGSGEEGEESEGQVCPHPASPPLELHAVSAGYPPPRGAEIRDVIRDVNLRLGTGEVVALMGPNGAGKSTCLRVLSGLVTPRVGSARLFGADLARLTRREIAARLAVVGQGNEMAPGFRVDQVVMMGRSPHQGGWHQATDEDHAAVADALAHTGIEHLAPRLVSHLSGGEQKLVALARAFAQSPKVLLLDEPSAHLDPRHTIELLELVSRQVHQAKTACLAIVHDLNLAAAFADRVVLLSDGRVRADGPPREVMTADNLRDVFGVELSIGEVGGARVFVPRRAP